jgi:hypothetical protein
MRREWAMPNCNTFEIPPIREMVGRYLAQSKCSVDPFARNNRWATWTNDLNPDTKAEYHMDAEAFLIMLKDRGVVADMVLFDPPYSLRQVKEVYDAGGHRMTGHELNYGRIRAAVRPILADSAIVLSFGWNSHGMGGACGFEMTELLIVCHGGAHNDTICVAERRRAEPPLFAGIAFGEPA